MRLKLRSKILLIAGTTGVAFALTIIAGGVISNQVESELASIQSHLLPKVELGPKLEGIYERVRRSFQDAVAAQDLEISTDGRQLKEEFLERLAAANDIVDPGVAVELRAAFEEYYKAAYDVSRRLIMKETGEGLVMATVSMQVKQAKVSELLKAATALQKNEIAEAFNSVKRARQKGANLQLLISVISLFFVLVISFWLSRDILRSMRELSAGFERFGRGEFESSIRIFSADDIGEASERANQMANNLQRLAEERNRADWLKNGQVGLAQELRGELEPDEAATRAIHFFSRYLDAPLGAFYYNEGNILRMIGKYAGAPVRQEFYMGEGLVGEAALREDIMIVEDPPPEYFHIRSGLGDASPRTIVLLPLLHLGRVIGVIEVALFKPWSELYREFFISIREMLAISVEVARARKAMRELLAETQNQATRLALQEEKLRSTNDEMKSQQEELRRANNELTQQTKELEAQRRVLEQKNAELSETQKRLEQKSEELATVSAYKSEFLANMSHELRTPLNSLLLLSGLLSENENKNFTPKQVEYLNTIHSAGKDLLALINQVLDLAKIESGKQDVRVETITLESLVRHVNHVFGPMARSKGLYLLVQLDSDLPKMIRTDRQRIEQILNNLLSNAIKFTDSGKVTFHISKASRGISFSRKELVPDKTVVFSVSDSGIGIAPENMERIFAPFEQAEKSITRRFGGTGLGLTIARDLATMLGGEMRVQSTPGKGSSFICYLPYEYSGELASTEAENKSAQARLSLVKPREENQNISQIESDQAAVLSKQLADQRLYPKDLKLSGKKILVVEDDIRTVYALMAVLKGKGAEVITAENGRVALEVLNKHPDTKAVLMDIMMPEMDGYEAMQLIRQDERFQDLPVIALTAKAMKGDREKCLQAGASDYIQKPVDADRLLGVLHLWLSRSKERASI